MADITATVDRLRAALLRYDAETQRAVVAAYRVAVRAINAELDAVTDRIADAIANGEPVGPSWLYRQDRYRRLIAQAEQAMAQFAQDAGNVITQSQRTAVDQAGLDAATASLAAMGEPPVTGFGVNFARLPESALTELIATLQPGSPLYDLLADFGEGVLKAVSDALIEGLAIGRGPNQVAADVRRAMGGEAWKARRIARTEMLRSYREAARRNYVNNPNIVKGWRWRCTRSSRTCAACLAMDGRRFAVQVPMGSHPNCRCYLEPITVTWRDLGFDVPETLPVQEDAADWFDRQPAATKTKVLGPEKAALYQDDAIELRDLVHTSRSNRWGTSRTVASTDEALENAAARRRRAA